MRPELLRSLDGQKVAREKSAFTQGLSEWLQPSETIKHPSLYLVNTRLWLNQLSQKYGHLTTIGEIPSQEWQSLFEKYDYFWFMGIYTPSPASQEHAKKFVHQYRYALPDVRADKDVVASPFAIPEYHPNRLIARDWGEWDRMVSLLHAHGKKVFIDFVPNHTALDHPWATLHPDYYVQGTQQQYHAHPGFYHSVIARDGRTHYLAHGKDPNSPEWSDTLQLNYAHPRVSKEMSDILKNLSQHADGLRCDMAMLLTPSTFLRTWGWALEPEEINFVRSRPFWNNLPSRNGLLLMGEIYWDVNELSQVFNYIYDKGFYDRLIGVTNGQGLGPLRSHLAYLLSDSYHRQHHQNILFVENHDEQRASAKLGSELSRAAAALAATIPHTLFMVNQGQDLGLHIRPPMQINRFPNEVPNPQTIRFFENLLALKRSRLFQTSNWEFANVFTNDHGLVALKVTAPDNSLAAIICVNLSPGYVGCSLPEVDKYKEATVISLTQDIVIPPDPTRNNGLYVGLKSGEVQVVFYADAI